MADNNKHPNMHHNADSMFHYPPEYHDARMSDGYDFCTRALEVQTHMVQIFNFHMCVKPVDINLWLKVTKDFSTKMFLAEARVKNNNISVICKRALVDILKELQKECVHPICCNRYVC